MDGREYIEISYSEECSNWFRNFLAGDITKLEQFLSISGSYTPLSGFRLVYACKVAKTHTFALFHQKSGLPGTESMTKFSSFEISSLDLAFSLYGFGRNSLTDFRDWRFERGLVTTKCS